VDDRLHALTWVVWALAAAVSVQLAPSPVYVALVLAVAVLVVAAHGGASALAPAFPVVVGLAVGFAVLRVVLTTLTTHTGEDVLVTMPVVTLPRILGGFDVGGTVEAGVAARSATEAFALVGVVAAFAAFHAVVPLAELAAVVPRAYHEPGLVVTVALAFVPSTLRAVREVREADRARTGGRVVRRGRTLRQLVPVLESGLERAVALAESMDARGFGRGAPAPEERAATWCAALALLGLAGALVALVGGAAGLAGGLALAGAGALVAAVVVSSRGTRRTRYQLRRLASVDRWVALVVVLAPIGLALLGAGGDEGLRWAGDPLGLPPVSPLGVVAVAALAAPLLLTARTPAFSPADRAVQRRDRQAGTEPAAEPT